MHVKKIPHENHTKQLEMSRPRLRSAAKTSNILTK